MKSIRFLTSLVGLAGFAAAAHAQSFAPSTNLGNTYFTGTITAATNGANGDGTVNDFFTASGVDYSVSQAGVFSAPVAYTYANTGANTGTITEPGLSVTLTFTSDTGGTFAATYSGGGTQAGTFAINSAGYAPPLSDVSTLTTLAAGGTATTGFYVAGGVPRMVLIRAVGPGLASFGVAGTLSSPTLTLWNENSGTMIVAGGSTTASTQSIMSAVGAFALQVGSKDSVIVTTLNPGGYAARVQGGSGSDSGIVLLEVYYLN
jgi:hypothetical protein